MEVTIEQALSDFGLSFKEQKVFLAALEIGTSTAQQITEKADLNRSTTYDLLRTLIEKGLCSTVIKNKKTHFEVVHPKRLIALLEERKQKISAVLDQLEDIKKNSVAKPLVELYEGRDGIEYCLESLLEENEEVCVYGPSSMFDVLSFILPRYIQKRREKKLKARVIQEESEKTSQITKQDKEELRQTRFIKDYHPTAAVFISGKKMVTIRATKREPLCILIIDNHIAKSQKEFFERVWVQALHC